jgi:hypothetical protein
LVCCPIALVEIVGIYGVEGMMGAPGKRVVVAGVRHRSVGVDAAAVVEMGGRSSRMRRFRKKMMVVAQHLVVKVGLGYRIGIAVDAVVVVVIVRMLVPVMRLEIGVSEGRIYVLYVGLEARVKGHVHVVVHGGLSIGQARRAERLVGGL